jgi:glycosyltransferase involved in cell wall biosynthesis
MPRKGAAGGLRIDVLSQIDPTSPRTNSIADLRLCAGLAAHGYTVALVAPAARASRADASELLATYGLETEFQVRYISSPRRNGGDLRGTVALLGKHSWQAIGKRDSRVLISRDPKLLLPYLTVGRMRIRQLVTAPWLHEFRNKRLERLVCGNATCILATNSAILRDLPESGISNARAFVTGNPVPGERLEFGRACSKAEARRRLELDPRRPVVAYTGKLYVGMRELEYLLGAAARLPEYLFLFTGGLPIVLETLHQRMREEGIQNVLLAGKLDDPEETRFYQQAADVLVSYYSTEDHPYARHNLPNKLAEYMTTGNPIVAADFPAVRELLNSENAFLVEPDDVDALTDALALAIRRKDESMALAARAQRDVAGRTIESVGAALGAFLVETVEALDGS